MNVEPVMMIALMTVYRTVLEIGVGLQLLMNVVFVKVMVALVISL